MRLTHKNWVEVLSLAMCRGTDAALDQFESLKSQGPKYRLTQDGKTMAVLYDDVGSAWIRVNGRCPGHRALKRMLKAEPLTFVEYTEDGYAGGWILQFPPIYDGREKSCYEVAYRAALNLLTDYGFEGKVESTMGDLT